MFTCPKYVVKCFINSQLLLHCFYRLGRPDAKKFVPPNLTWDPMISALLEACQEILNCQIMTVTEKPLRSTMVLESLRQRTTRSLLLPNLSSHQQQSELIFMQEHYFHFASSSSMSYTGLSIYDNPFFLKKSVQYTPFHYIMKATLQQLFAFAKQYTEY